VADARVQDADEHLARSQLRVEVNLLDREGRFRRAQDSGFHAHTPGFGEH
jgi:hypothetical protein